MKITKKIVTLLLSICMIIVLGACTKTDKTPSEDQKTTVEENKQPVTLTVSAAASLKDAMEQIKEVYSKDHPNVTLTYNFGASGSLQQQIEQGAPADVFISAANKQMDALQSKNLILEDTKKTLVENELVLVAPKDSAVKGFEDLTGSTVKKIAVGEPKSVPAGKYAQEVFDFLKITEQVKEKTVQAKDVREVLSWVETGNADAGLVYETDAKVSQGVKIIAAAPEKSHSPILYPVAVVKASKQVEEAKEFVTFLLSDAAQKVFGGYGFHVIK